MIDSAWRRVGLLVAVLVLFSCKDRTALVGWLEGCSYIQKGPICVRSDARPTELRVWLAAAASPRVLVDGDPVAATLARLGRDVRLVFSVGVDAHRVEVVDAQRTFAFELAIDDGDDEPMRVRAREALRAGDGDTAVEWYDRSRIHNLKRGHLSRAVRDGQAAAYALLHFGEDLNAARARLAAARDSLRHDRRLWAMMPYYEGLIERAGLNFDVAVERFEEAQRRLEWLEQPFWQAGNEAALASSLQALGRYTEAEPILERLAHADFSAPCAKAQHLNNYAWVRLIGDDRARRTPDVATAHALETAYQIYRDGRCEAPRKLALVAQHRALVEVLSGRLDAAEAMLAEAVVDRTEERLWMMELRARIARRRGDFDASDRWVDEGLRRAGILHPDARRRLYRVRAEAAIDRADDERALLAFDAADEVLDERLSRIPFGEGRAAFLASIQSEQDVRLGLLVRSEQDERALEVLRRTRSRAVARAAMGLRIRDLSARARQRWEEDISAIRSIRRALQDAAEDAWTLDHDAFIVWQKTQAAVVQQMQDKLRAALKAVEPEVERVRNREAWTRSRPAPGDLWLAFGRAVDPHSAPRPDALVFVHTSSITKVLTYGPKLWTEAASPWIRAARRIVILSSPSMLDAHTDPWRGIPLNIARPVAYTLDLPVADEGSSGWSPRALLVADPRRNLEGARREASAVSKAMRRAGFVVRALTGRHAELSAVVDGLETAATFHYAGHGHANPDEPWSDRLELSSDALRVSDILTLEHAPRFVVLTGCKTAFVSGEVERVHLAQAFLLAGSRQVVAAGRRVSDAFARSLGPRLYSKAPTDLMTRFAKAAAELEALGMTEWRAFRVWIP